MTAVSFDAFGGAEAFAVVGVAHAGVAIALAGWSHKEKDENSLKKQLSRQRQILLWRRSGSLDHI